MALAVENSATDASASVNYSTSGANRIVCLFAKYGGPSEAPTGVSDTGGLTWVKRKSVNVATIGVDLWYAVAAAQQTAKTITVTGTSSNQRSTVFSISGANINVPFDDNATLPASNSGLVVSSLTCTVSTSNPKNMLIATVGCDGLTGLGTVTRPTSFSQILATGSFEDVSSLLVSSLQSSVSEVYSWTATITCAAMIVDAIQAAEPAPIYYNRMIGGM